MKAKLAAATACLSLLILVRAATPPPSNVTLVWNRSPGTNIAGYNLYVGAATRSYTNKINTGNSTNVTIGNLTTNATYFFAATAYDSNGLESDYSNEISYRAGSGPSGTNAPPKTNVLTVNFIVRTATNILGPWTTLTNLNVFSATNPPGQRFFQGSLAITNAVK